jgi:hypothetical protein
MNSIFDKFLGNFLYVPLVQQEKEVQEVDKPYQRVQKGVCICIKLEAAFDLYTT